MADGKSATKMKIAVWLSSCGSKDYSAADVRLSDGCYSLCHAGYKRGPYGGMLCKSCVCGSRECALWEGMDVVCVC